MTSKHTPGPWWTDGEYNHDEAGCAVLAARTDCGPLPGNPTRGMVAWASELLLENAERCAANARLIAAAPDLLEALIDITPHMPPADASCHAGLVPQELCGHCSRIAKARAAIAKATGGSND